MPKWDNIISSFSLAERDDTGIYPDSSVDAAIKNAAGKLLLEEISKEEVSKMGIVLQPGETLYGRKEVVCDG